MAKMTKDFMAGWLQGFADGEGCVPLKLNHTYREINLVNSDRALIDVASDYLRHLGIEHHIHCYNGREGTKPQWRIIISGRDNLMRWQKFIGFASPHKTARLNEAINTYKQIRNRYSGEELRQLYFDKKLTQHQIAEMFGQSRTAIKYWLSKFGLRRRGVHNEAIV